MDWDSDPDLAKIRKEFIQSFQERLKSLDAVIRSMAATLERKQLAAPEDVVQLRYIAHKLGGTAASYGFPRLGENAMLLDDRIDEFVESGDRAVHLERFPAEDFLKAARELHQMLSLAAQDERDPIG